MADKSQKGRFLNIFSRKRPVQKPVSCPLQKNKEITFYKKYNFQVYMLWIAMTVLLTVFIVPSLRFRITSIIVGDISPKDIKAPQDFSVEDHETTIERQKQAEESVLPVYDYNDRLYSDLVEKIHLMFTHMRTFYNEKTAALSFKDPNVTLSLNSDNVETEASIPQLEGPQPYIENIEKDWAQEWTKFAQNKGLNLSYKQYLIFEGLGFDSSIENEMIKIIHEIMRKGIVPSYSFSFDEPKKGMVKRVLSTKTEVILKDVSGILDLKAAQDYSATMLKAFLPKDEAAANEIIQILQGYVTPNLTFNLSETHYRIDLARKSVKPAFFQIKKGEMVIREGERARKDQVEKLNALKKIKKQEGVFRTIFGLGFVVGLTLILLFILLKRFRSKFVSEFSNLLLVAISILITTGIMRLSVFIAHGLPSTIPIVPPQSYYFAFPFATAAIIVAILLDVEIAIMVAAVISILAGILLNMDLNFFIVSFLGSLGGIYFLSFRKNRANIIKSGFVVGLVNMGVIIPINLLQGTLFTLTGLFNTALGFLGGIIVVAVVLSFLPVLESVFQVTTDMMLLEHLNLNQPLLRRLAIEAPGTYHHCIVVANLAEAACEAINANSLLARVAAYYHDIGKIKMPRYYIENQMDFKNEHEKLSPSMSSLILISHIKDGVELGRKYRLSRPIIDIIKQHHGTGLIKYFFAKAKEMQAKEGQDVKEEDYRYPGPKPQTKEAGIVMLADAVEATSRTLTDPRPARIQGMIQNIINNIFRDGQLDECELTLKDLHQIAGSFNLILTGIFHPRVIYPGTNVLEEGKKEKGGKGGDSNSKPPKEAKAGQLADKEDSGEDIRRLGIQDPGSEYNIRK
ncbi:HDIG domain-containing protein [bacterium]|nr:HDIG domain-containing protein [bacterium]